LTDTIPVNIGEAATTKIRILSVADLLAEAIRRIHEDESVSSLFA
jgi:ribose-phosphate pyrophosphokinase